MSGRGRGKLPGRKVPAELVQVNENAGGVDVGATSQYAAVPPGRDPQGQDVREFGACTADLLELAAWLKRCRVISVALEATGVYWVPVVEVLEAQGLEVHLVDPRSLRRPKKSDVLDCQWLQQMHSYGLLQAAFRPPEPLNMLRSYWRQRGRLIEAAAQQVQHMQKALTEMNVQLHHVVSDLTGVTGMKIVQAIVSGERDPEQLARLRHPTCKRDEASFARALQGHWRADHLFALQQAVELYTIYQQKMAACEQEIERHLATCADRTQGRPVPPRARPRAHAHNEPAFELREHLYRLSGVDLTRIDGIDACTAMTVLSETGVDMQPWPSGKHFVSWLRLSPNHRISGRKILSRRTAPGANRAATALRLAAQALHHSQSALGAFYRRKRTQLGAPKAITATARKLARLIYSMLRYGTQYVDRGVAYYEEQYRQRALRALTERAKSLGYKLVDIEPPKKLVLTACPTSP
jgi:transposase